jgi:hypothetical protein
MEDVGILYGHLVYFTAIWYILCTFGLFYSHLVYFFPVLVCCTKKNLATLTSGWPQNRARRLCMAADQNAHTSYIVSVT